MLVVNLTTVTCSGEEGCTAPSIGDGIKLVELHDPPDEELLATLAGVLRGYFEIEWASYCHVARPAGPPSPAIGLRVADNYRDNVTAIIKDITEVIVLGMVGWAAYRRIVVKPARLSDSIEALVVLGMIAGLNEVNPDETTVEEAMTQEAYTVAKDTPMFDVLREMLEHKYGSAIVVEGMKIIGILTTHDALQLLVDNFPNV